MKTFYLNLLISLLVITFTGIFQSNAQTSNQSGDWEVEETWDNNEEMPTRIGNNYKNDIVTILSGHHVYLGDENNMTDLEVDKNGFEISVQGVFDLSGNLDAGNELTISVGGNGVFTIDGNVDVHNDLVVEVEEGGQFIVKGIIDMHNNADIEVNGMLVADGIKGHNENQNNISGTGDIYVDDIDGVNSDGFQGYIVGDNTNLEIQPPYNLTAEVDGELQVTLTWDYNESSIDKEYTFVGFQVFRNLNGLMHYDDIVKGEIVNGEFTGDKDNLFEDPHQFEPGDTPVYYVRSVFASEQKNNAYEFSPISNIVNFSESPLPIDLISFDANTGAEGVNIQWTTATEINNDYFTIERSTDGQNWEVLAFVQGHGNSNQVIHYDYTDALPLEGVSYYRLKQTDFDGQFEYFAPEVVLFSTVKTGTEIVNTNVHNQQMDIWLQNQDPASVLVIADVSGRIVHRQMVESHDYTQQLNINLPGNVSGEILLVRLYSNQNSDQTKVFAQ